MSNCNKATYTYPTGSPYRTECRNSINGFNGHYFSWCFVMRYAAQLCPAPWRVPTVEDFVALHRSLGYTTVPAVDGSASLIANTYSGTTGTGPAAVLHGGTWGGTRFTGYAPDSLSLGTTRYWSSSSYSSGLAHTLRYTTQQASPQYTNSKRNGYPLRCVRNN